MTRLLIVIGLAVGCSRPPASIPANEAAALPDMPWCFAVTLDMDGDDTPWRACTAAESDCERLQSMARQHGGRAGITGVSACTSD